MTDRVELTKDEVEALMEDALGWMAWDEDHPLLAAVASIVTARVQALTAERDTLRIDLRTCERLSREAADAARAELAAANTRCAELDEKLDRLSTEIMDQNAEKWGDQPLTDDEKALLLRFNALSVVLDKSEAKNAALQATLDRVTALADEWEAKAGEGIYSQERERAAALRAALTPEVKP